MRNSRSNSLGVQSSDMVAFPPRILLIATVLLGCTPLFAQSAAATDSDHDGLSDDFEQSLLQKFQPKLMISASDCAGTPARFKPGASPEVEAKDGTIYGQVFPASADKVEVHYYTLWDRDCGRVPHALDAEHVAALISISGAEPKALYWYAGAHEKTACDISSGARATALDAEDHGPQVWSSAGKHALYFTKVKCDSGSGCGADSCADNVELAREVNVVNIGERHVPANGSDWIASPAWVLGDKMGSNFTPEMVKIVDAAPPGAVVTVAGRSTFRGTIAVSDTVLGSMNNSAQHTSDALDNADTHTSNSLQKASDATGRSLKRAWHAVFGNKPAPAEK
ncbi:hypothetical protein Acid345_0989 [Candidatus Koribacter versatilis Ellin345]|uniref:Uncharacterized protein n=1 Tax=Koribacter versatilis (strain Ellin345) TaxID=204669 RepID=Q1IT08_KORVE|nr:hypothetical protein [Candidatus Koribacter versatilis]ABF39992.1 hypothetical protein Acid345_0989 [Candidatus Koribacter versatilis Ellin345]